jgi:hypothetical protein
MPYEVEDEIDWSDSPLGPPSPEPSVPPVDSSFVVGVPQIKQDTDSLFMPEMTSPYVLPTGTPLPFSTHVDLAQYQTFAHLSQLLDPTHASKPFLLVHNARGSVSI